MPLHDLRPRRAPRRCQSPRAYRMSRPRRRWLHPSHGLHPPRRLHAPFDAGTRLRHQLRKYGAGLPGLAAALARARKQQKAEQLKKYEARNPSLAAAIRRAKREHNGDEVMHQPPMASSQDPLSAWHDNCIKNRFKRCGLKRCHTSTGT